ncbi:uncharacterized protein Dvir_GJ27097 [Drosophila virilis]|uniref:Uncharacterized protein n=1 Tax=Drosophila virilis TaxID=7244 RepID=A0A0Q9WJK4_DROVI|nr:uncharacterized protein Dvir_GJ27097 [Drosophila virilis]
MSDTSGWRPCDFIRAARPLGQYRKLVSKMRSLCFKILQMAMLLALVMYQKRIASVADAEQFESDCRCQRRG